MQQLHYFITVVLVCILMSCADQQDEVSRLVDEPEEAQASLPFTKMLLEDMTAFAPSGANWSIAGSVFADLEQEGHLEMTDGLGVLVNKPKEGANENLRSAWEHGDLELHVDVLMPKGSNSGIYFQGRYEIQLLDSWKEVEPAHKDIGGVYQQWNDAKPEGEKGFDGVSPSINAARAPGLWQHFHILFRAPRFSVDGQKIADARFEYVYLNGMLVQDNVTVSGPTRAHQMEGEAPLGPLFLQGDHGPVAFRNIQYKTYGSDTLQLSNISYRTFTGQWNHLPDFDTLEAVKAGKLKHLDLKGASESPNDFGVIFTGDLSVPTTGTYLFEMQADDRAILSIGSQRVVTDGEKGGGLIRGFAELEKGIRSFELMYQQERGRASLNVRYEGPHIALRPLAESPSDGNTNTKDLDPILVEVTEVPEMVRGFVMHKGEKRTHTISVGTPNGVHFSYDLRQGALLKAWKGDFADVTNMWQGRGASQLLLPLNAAIELHAAMPIAHVSEHEFWPQGSEDMRYVGYDMDEKQMPVFRYVLDGSQISDQVSCADGKVRRQISVQGNDIEHYDMLLAAAASILRQDNGLFNIDGQYYIDTQEDVRIHNFAEHFELRLRVDKGLASYDIIW